MWLAVLNKTKKNYIMSKKYDNICRSTVGLANGEYPWYQRCAWVLGVPIYIYFFAERSSML